MMSAIFGEDANNELFSVNNGMIMSDMAEERFDQGYFVIVPDVSDTHPGKISSDGIRLTPKDTASRSSIPPTRR
jgi:hypothetical protein